RTKMISVHRVAVLELAGTYFALAGACIPVGLQNQQRGLGSRRVTNDIRSGLQCPVRGVWDLVSVSVDGKDQPLNGYKQIHVLTERYSIWIGQFREAGYAAPQDRDRHSASIPDPRRGGHLQ